MIAPVQGVVRLSFQLQWTIGSVCGCRRISESALCLGTHLIMQVDEEGFKVAMPAQVLAFCKPNFTGRDASQWVQGTRGSGVGTYQTITWMKMQ